MHAGLRRKWPLFPGLLFLAGLGVLPAAATLAAPPVPEPPTPGAIGDTLKQPPQLQPPAAAPIATPQSRAPTGAAQGPTLVVSSFVFSGNTVFSGEQLAPLVAGYLNRPISLGQLYEAADKVAEFYASRGYALASVNLPAQKVKDGVVRLEVIEGRIGRIGFDGNHTYSSALLGRFVTETQPQQVYRTAPLEQDLQTLNALPGLAARAVIRPGASYGTSDLTVKVEETPLSGYVVLDNYGRKDSGEYRVSADVTLNNPFRIGDQVQVLGTHADNNMLNYGYIDYNLPLVWGLRADLNYGRAYFRVTSFDTTGYNNNYQFTLSKPWLRTSVDTFSTSAGFIHTEANADLAGFALSNTNVNLLNLGLSYAHTWLDGAVTQYIASIHSNFSPPSDNRPNGEPFRFEINAQHLQPLPARLQILLQVDAVVSPDPLPDTEQLSIGGPSSIRGFPTSEARGDRGYYGQLSLRRPYTFGRLAFVPRIYWDTGEVTQLTLIEGQPNNSQSLSSAGVGADWIYRTFDLKVDWSYPFDGKPVSDGRDSGRVYAALTAGF